MEFDLPEIEPGSAAHAVLIAYSRKEAGEIIIEQSSPAWLRRLAELQDVEPDQLAKAHGHLIALGYLEFDLVSRSEGIAYRLTGDAKRWMEAA